MPESKPDNLQEQIEERIRYHQELGIHLFYKDRRGGVNTAPTGNQAPTNVMPIESLEESSLPKTASQAKPLKPAVNASIPLPEVTLPASGISLFAAAQKVSDDS